MIYVQDQDLFYHFKIYLQGQDLHKKIMIYLQDHGLQYKIMSNLHTRSVAPGRVVDSALNSESGNWDVNWAVPCIVVYRHVKV